MIRRLQRKFVAIAMGSLLAVMVVVIGAINAANFVQINSRAQWLLQTLAENDGRFPEFEKGKPPGPVPKMGFEMTAETRFETRYFLARADASGSITEIDTGHIAAVSSEQARQMAESVLNSGRTGGYLDYYRYMVTAAEEGSLVLFVDCGSQIRTGLSFLLASCGVGVVCFYVVFILVTVFSRRAVAPVIESLEKQRRFMTDASHEIKTPLAIISANTAVLELEEGESEWIQSIRNQTQRLNRLVEKLMLLCKMEEEENQAVFAPFHLSEAVADAAAPFETLAESRGKTLKATIEPGITMKGDESGIRELIAILLDNAVKYADNGSEISLEIARKARGVQLKVSNLCSSPPEGNLERLFDRFYRADSSRSRETGGYGVGLSIARAIVQTHRGKIAAQSITKDKTVCFIITLPIA